MQNPETIEERTGNVSGRVTKVLNDYMLSSFFATELIFTKKETYGWEFEEDNETLATQTLVKIQDDGTHTAVTDLGDGSLSVVKTRTSGPNSSYSAHIYPNHEVKFSHVSEYQNRNHPDRSAWLEDLESDLQEIWYLMVILLKLD